MLPVSEQLKLGILLNLLSYLRGILALLRLFPQQAQLSWELKLTFYSLNTLVKMLYSLQAKRFEHTTLEYVFHQFHLFKYPLRFKLHPLHLFQYLLAESNLNQR